MTRARKTLYPIALACALFGLGGCGLFIDESPTDATLATMNGLQAITEAIGTAVLPLDVSGTTLPFAATGPGTPEEGELAAYGGSLVQALGGTSQPLDAVPLPNGPDPSCPVSGTVALTGTADVTDTRDVNGHGTVTILFGTAALGTMSAVANACVGYGHRSTGGLNAGANDTISITHWADPNIDRWQVSRDEIASGSLTVTKVSTGATHNVSFNWRRVGSLDLTVDESGATPYVELLAQSQSLYLTVNGQTCTGVYTGRLLTPYDWDCSGG